MSEAQDAQAQTGAPAGSPTIRWTARLLDWGAGVVLFAMMAMTCVDVIGRYFFNSPLSITTDYTRLAMALIVFTVFPAICWFEEHICVDILDAVFPNAPRQPAPDHHQPVRRQSPSASSPDASGSSPSAPRARAT